MGGVAPTAKQARQERLCDLLGDQGASLMMTMARYYELRGEERGELRGELRGAKLARKQIAQRMLLENISLSTVAKCSKLSHDELLRLLEDLEVLEN